MGAYVRVGRLANRRNKLMSIRETAAKACQTIKIAGAVTAWTGTGVFVVYMFFLIIFFMDSDPRLEYSSVTRTYTTEEIAENGVIHRIEVPGETYFVDKDGHPVDSLPPYEPLEQPSTKYLFLGLILALIGGLVELGGKKVESMVVKSP